MTPGSTRRPLGRLAHADVLRPARATARTGCARRGAGGVALTSVAGPVAGLAVSPASDSTSVLPSVFAPSVGGASVFAPAVGGASVFAPAVGAGSVFALSAGTSVLASAPAGCA